MSLAKIVSFPNASSGLTAWVSENAILRKEIGLYGHIAGITVRKGESIMSAFVPLQIALYMPTD